MYGSRLQKHGTLFSIVSILWALCLYSAASAEFELLPTVMVESGSGQSCCMLLDLLSARNVTKAQYRRLQEVRIPVVVDEAATSWVSADLIRSLLGEIMDEPFVLIGKGSLLRRVKVSDGTASLPSAYVSGSSDVTGNANDSRRDYGNSAYASSLGGFGSGGNSEAISLTAGWGDRSDSTARFETTTASQNHLVKTGDSVKAIYRNGAMEVSMNVVALGSGRAGEEIQVRSGTSGKKLRALVVGEGVVQIVLAR